MTLTISATAKKLSKIWNKLMTSKCSFCTERCSAYCWRRHGFGTYWPQRDGPVSYSSVLKKSLPLIHLPQSWISLYLTASGCINIWYFKKSLMQSSTLMIVLFQFMQNSEQKKICTNFIFWLSVTGCGCEHCHCASSYHRFSSNIIGMITLFVLLLRTIKTKL